MFDTEEQPQEVPSCMSERYRERESERSPSLIASQLVIYIYICLISRWVYS